MTYFVSTFKYTPFVGAVMARAEALRIVRVLALRPHPGLAVIDLQVNLKRLAELGERATSSLAA